MSTKAISSTSGRRGLARAAIAAALMVAGASAASAQGAAEPVAIRIGGNDAAHGSTPIFLAQRLGYYKEAGLDVKYVILGGGAAPMAAALKANEIDVAVAGALQHMTDIARGVITGKIIGEVTDSNTLHFIGGNGVTDIKQMKGKVFGISSYNGGDHLFALAVLGYYGIGPDDATYLPLGVPTARIAAMTTGKVDATTMPAVELASMSDSTMEKGKIKVILSGTDNPIPFVTGAIFATQTAIAAKKAALQKFLAATGKASDWARAHPDDAIAACQDSGASAALCKVAIEVYTGSKGGFTWSSTSRANVEAIKGMIPLYATAIPQLKNLTIADFVDASLVP